jgi:regulator of protease activity HflC (stomatin/prohibitin superfamily)
VKIENLIYSNVYLAKILSKIHKKMSNKNNIMPIQELTKNDTSKRIGLLRWLGNIVKKNVDVPDYHKIVVTEYKNYIRTVGSGVCQINSCTEEYKIIPETIIGEYQKGAFIRNGIFVSLLEKGIYFANPALREDIIIINATIIGEYQKGIFIRNGKFEKELEPGEHYANSFLREEIVIVNLIIIRETYLGVMLIDGKFEKIVKPGKHFINTFLKQELKEVSEIVIMENYEGILLINGQFNKLLKPRRYFANPYLKEEIILVDMRITTKELVPQTIVTKDTTTFSINSILIYKIVDSVNATLSINNVDHAIREQIKSMSQQVLSEHDLDYIMANKMILSGTIRDRVKNKCSLWGIELIAIDIKELILPSELQLELTESARAKRSSEALLIRGEAEVKNAEKQQQVAKMLSSPSSTHMREMETIREIFANPNTKAMFIASGLNSLIGSGDYNYALSLGATHLNSMRSVLRTERRYVVESSSTSGFAALRLHNE